MKKIIASLLFSLIFTAGLLAQTKNKQTASSYGVKGSEISTIKLDLYKDGSFDYINRSNPEKQVSLTGKYEKSGQKILLKADQANANFIDRWKISDDGEAIKSRKGLAWYRLCKLES